MLLCALSFGVFAQINSVGLIGSGTPTGWDSDTDMTQVNDSTWTLTITLSKGDGSGGQGYAKFRADDAWDVNWGSESFPVGTGDQGGDNIPIFFDGEYTITFNSNSGYYEFEIASPIGIIGTATPRGWDADFNLFPDSLGGSKFYTTLEMPQGEAKFRANDNWDGSNWGSSDFPNGTGTQGGSNIPVAAGTYNITFDSMTGEYSFQNIDFQKMKLIGSGVPMGGVDSLMRSPSDAKLWVGRMTLTDGDIQFQADEDANSTWGGTDFPSGTAELGGGGIPVTAAEYYVTFNVETLEYNFQEVIDYSTLGIIGDATPGGFDMSTPLTQDPNDVAIWTGRVNLTEGEMIFIAEDDFSIIWSSGDFPTGTGVNGGANIPVSPAGDYGIEFNSITGEYTFTLFEIYSTVGIIGTATPLGNWDTDIDMTQDPNDEERWFISEILLTDGMECKFRAEDDWAVNWGAFDDNTVSDLSGIGSQDGPNFEVPGGLYGITLKAVKDAGEYVFGPVLSAADLLDLNFVELSPNPATDVLNIRLKDDRLGGDMNVTIFSTQGQQVYANTMRIDEFATIQLGDLQPGTYLLHLTNGQYIVGKQFIVTK